MATVTTTTPTTTIDITRSAQRIRYRTLDEFWPYYVREHSQPLNRTLHFIGNTNLILWLIVASSKRSFRYLVFAVVSSYLFAWVGHFVFERNIPATFRYPILSALGDITMYMKMLDGTMDAEIAKYCGEPSRREA